MYTTRIAPSPTGDMHIGTARTAYFNWLAARASGGTFVLRIDDTDLDRHNEDAVTVIFDTMDWLGLDYDKVVRQRDRLDLYKAAALTLIENNLAFVLDNGAVQLNSSLLTIPSHWHDEICGDVKISDKDRESISNLILIKGDGMPTYHFASVVDDIDLNINYVIRGNDHISNTAKHVAIYLALDAVSDSKLTLPKFAHLGLIHKDKKKLNKRDGAASMLHYRDTGYDVDGLLNFMARQGWGPTVDDKSAAVLPRDRMLELFFDGGKMRAAPSNFDQALLDSFDRKYKARKEHEKRATDENCRNICQTYE